MREISRYQRQVFLIAWLGWSLDNTDFSLFALVLRPALTELPGGNPTFGEMGQVGGILGMVGLLGWARGGFCLATVADYLGRVRVLALSILMVAVWPWCSAERRATTSCRTNLACRGNTHINRRITRRRAPGAARHPSHRKPGHR